MQHPTVSDVAAAAGVSTATVSRALSGNGRVNEATRKRVEKVAASLGYTGNSIARALRSQRSDIVGMVVPSISNPFFTALVEAVEHELQRVGKTLFLCDSKGNVVLEARRIRSLRDSHVDGIIISPCHGVQSADAINSIPSSTPVVQLDQFVHSTASDWVGIDDDTAVELVMDHVASLGATSAVFVSSASTNSSAQARMAAFNRCAAERNIAVGPDDILLGRFSVEWGEKVAATLLERDSLPDVIVCGADVIAFGIIRGLTSAGVKVPHDVKVTGFDDVAFASIISPSLTTIRQPTTALAAEAVRLLGNHSSVTAGTHAKVTLRPELIVRESTAALPATSSEDVS